MSKILFSPIGGSDPIRNYKDGSMLHICRNYLPDKVYLYLSYEMYQYHLKDNRYLYCLDQLGKFLNHPFEVEIIARPELKEVQSYETFYNDFMECIDKIRQQMTDEDELYLNIASGTPAMKSALLMLSVLVEYPLKTIQISTPLKRSNYTDENMSDYAVCEQWECNEDNTSEVESRCEEVHSVNLTRLIKLNIMKKHIDVFDYFAAYQVAMDIEKLLPARGMAMLQQAVERLQLNVEKVNRISEKIQYQPMPVTKAGDCEIIEYVLLLCVKVKRKEYDDFIRGITPIIVVLFEMALDKQCHIDLNDYCSEKESGVREWDRNKLQNTKILAQLNNKFSGNFRYGMISSWHLKILINENSNNVKLNKLVEHLRSVEDKARNLAAHNIVPVTADSIRYLTNYEPEQIMEDIKSLTEFVNAGINKSIWDSYERMNREICAELGEPMLSPPSSSV